MPLRDQPYLPLYIQDFLTDEKLACCSAKATGVYIRLMCLMHKSEQYGTILLKQKFKQSTDQIKNFATLISRQMPYDFHTVTESLVELLDENVLTMEGDILIQKRMVKDNNLSEIRAKAGKKGGKKTQDFAKAKAKAKTQASYENEIENEIPSFGKYENLFFDLTESERQNSIEYLHRVSQKTFKPPELDSFFQAFKIQYANDYHPNRSEVVKHFRNWLKNDQKQSKNGINGNQILPAEVQINV